MFNNIEMKHGENKRTNVAMIQVVVDRMDENLFFLRGWSITLLAGLFAVSIPSLLAVDNWAPILFFVLLILFWIYDGYFLSNIFCLKRMKAIQ